MQSAPIMIAGLLVGLFFTFFGYKARRLLVLTSSLFSGGLVSLALALFIQDPQGVIALLASGYTGGELFGLITSSSAPMGLLINVVSFAFGSLTLFFIARSAPRLARILLAILAPLSAALALLFTLRLFVGLSVSIALAAVSAFLIFTVSLISVEHYLAVESAIIAAMATSILITRFWYLDGWIFYLLWALLALLGMLNQFSMVKAKEQSRG